MQIDTAPTPQHELLIVNHTVISVSVATRTEYGMYLIRTCADLTLYLCLRCRCASAIMCIILCLFLIFTDIFFYSRVMEPVLRPRTALHCDDELMWEQQQHIVQTIQIRNLSIYLYISALIHLLIDHEPENRWSVRCVEQVFLATWAQLWRG